MVCGCWKTICEGLLWEEKGKEFSKDALYSEQVEGIEWSDDCKLDSPSIEARVKDKVSQRLTRG